MRNLPQTHITPVKSNPVVNLKMFMNYLAIANRKTGRKLYNSYLSALGKPDHLPLTANDIYKLDGVKLDVC